MADPGILGVGSSSAMPRPPAAAARRRGAFAVGSPEVKPKTAATWLDFTDIGSSIPSARLKPLSRAVGCAKKVLFGRGRHVNSIALVIPSLAREDNRW